MKGDIPGLEYLPLFHLPFLEFSAFQVAFHHPLVEFLPEFVKEIGAAVVLTALHVHIDVVAVLDFYAEDAEKASASSSTPISPLSIQSQVSRA